MTAALDWYTALMVFLTFSANSVSETNLLIANNDASGYTFLYTTVYSSGTHISNQWRVLASRTKTDFDYDFQSKYLFWTSFRDSKIYRSAIPSDISGSPTLKAEVILSFNRSYIGGISADWVNKRIYFTTKYGKDRYNGIHVTNYNGSIMKTLFSRDVIRPESIEVDPENGLMYWTDSETRRIERATMDGRQRTILVSSDLSWPVGLAIDKDDQRLYWTDYNRIESVDMDGGDRKELAKNVGDANKLTTTKLYVYAITAKEVFRINKANGEITKFVPDKLNSPRDIKVYDLQKQGSQVCGVKSDNCRYLCLPSINRQYSCHCENDIQKCVRNDLPNRLAVTKDPLTQKLKGFLKAKNYNTSSKTSNDAILTKSEDIQDRTSNKLSTQTAVDNPTRTTIHTTRISNCTQCKPPKNSKTRGDTPSEPLEDFSSSKIKATPPKILKIVIKVTQTNGTTKSNILKAIGRNITTIDALTRKLFKERTPTTSNYLENKTSTTYPTTNLKYLASTTPNGTRTTRSKDFKTTISQVNY